MTEAGRITAAIDGDVSGLSSALSKARSEATAAAAGIESDFKSKLGGGMSSLASDVSKSMQGGFGGIREGLTKSLTSGDFSSAGAGIGNQVVSGLSSSLGPIGGIAGELATTLGPSGIIALGAVAGGAAIGAALISGISSAVAAAGQFETAMSGAKKVISVDDSSADAYFKQLGSDLQELSTQAPVSANDLAALAAVGGSLGVASSEITGFAESAAQMSVAFELPAEEAATASAKILNAFQQPINTENMQSLGNVINQIGDSMAATEADVLDFTNRASFLNTTMGLSVTQVATLGGVLISAGLTAETAAGGLKSAMNSLTSETSKTGGMDNWAKLMGVSVDELKGKVASDLPNTLIETANKIAAIEDPVLRFQTAVALAGSEGAPALLKLAGATDTYNSALAQTISQWDKGQNGEAGGMAKTFAQNSSTYEASGQMLSNAMTYASVAIGNVFLPAATAATSGLTSFVVGAVQAGTAIGSLVSNSQAASAIGSAFASIGSIGSAVFGNLSAVITPVWEAIGGGETVMSGLQTVFNAVTAPITIFYTGVSALASGFAGLISAAQPAASAIGSGLASAITIASSAIQTGSAYVQAFGEAIYNLVANSEAAQTIGSIFDSISTSISGVIDFVSDIGSKIVSGLTTAIPQAASGFSSAIGSLMGQAGDAAGGYFEDAIKDTPLGGIFGFAESISSRASEIMATGEASAAAVAEGIDSSPELNESLKKAADFDDPENLAAAKAAGIDVGNTAGEGMKDAFAEQVKSLVDSGVSKELAAVMTGFGTTDINALNIINKQSSETGDYGGLFGRGSGTRVVKESGIEYSIKYSANSRGTDVSLYIDGQLMASGSNFGTQENAIRSLFAQANAKEKLTEKMILTFENRQGEAALIEENADAKLNLNVDWGQIEMAPATDILENVDWSKYADSSGTLSAVVGSTDWLKSVLENYVAEAGEGGQQAATELVTNFANALASPSMDALGDVQNWYEQIRSTLSNPLDIAALDAQMEQYKNRLVAGIADAGEYCKSESERIGGITSQAFTDGYLSDAERKSITDLIPELELLQSECPKEFGEAGLASQLEFARQAALSDQSSGDLLESYKRIAPAIESEITDEFLDFGKNLKDQMGGIGSDIGDALAEGMVPDADKIDDALANLRSLKIYDPEEFAAQGGENALAYLQGLQDAIDSYEAAKAKVIADPDDEAALASLASTRDRLQLFLDQNPLEVAEKVDTSMFGTSIDDIKGSINLADILADPEEFKEKVMDIPDFVDNVFQPTLSDEIDTMLEQWDSGYGEAREQTEKFVDGMAKTAKVMPDLFSERQRLLLDKYTAGLIDAKAALQGISAEANNTADAVERINFAQNAPEASYEDVMFYHSYIGPTSGYASWLTEESGRDETQVRQMLINLDTTEAEEALKTLDGEATAKQTKLVDVNSSAAMTEIRKIDEAASEPITKTVYVEYYDEGYDDNGNYSSSSSSSSSAKSFASEGYVASPTLAIVGDRPGGEYVVGAARFEAAAAKINSGGQTIVINHSPVINGSGLSKEELAEVLAKNNKELLKEVASQIRTGKSF